MAGEGSIRVSIDGKDYPCYVTVGALYRWADLRGARAITPAGAPLLESFKDTIDYFWCCVVAACARERMPFPLTREDFVDAIDFDTLGGWSEAIQALAGAPAEGSKKKG